MPIVRLQPSSSIGDFAGLGVVGAPTAHEALSDVSDASYVTLQLTEAEPLKWWRGTMTDLPDGIGVVTGVVINVRADNDETLLPTPSAKLASGEYNNIRLANTLTGSPVDYATAPLNLGTPSQVNALQYQAGIEWVAHTILGRIYTMNFDADCNFVTGVTVAMIFQWLGPLVAVGLREMPRLSLELWRRSGTFLRPHELEAAWREMREDRARRYFLPALKG